MTLSTVNLNLGRDFFGGANEPKLFMPMLAAVLIDCCPTPANGLGTLVVKIDIMLFDVIPGRGCIMQGLRFSRRHES
jgi:hypothetical protein